MLPRMIDELFPGKWVYEVTLTRSVSDPLRGNLKIGSVILYGGAVGECAIGPTTEKPLSTMMNYPIMQSTR